MFDTYLEYSSCHKFGSLKGHVILTCWYKPSHIYLFRERERGEDGGG